MNALFDQEAALLHVALSSKMNGAILATMID